MIKRQWKIIAKLSIIAVLCTGLLYGLLHKKNEQKVPTTYSNQTTGEVQIDENWMIINDPYRILYDTFETVSKMSEKEKVVREKRIKEYGEEKRYAPWIIKVKFKDTEEIQYLEEFFANKTTITSRNKRQVKKAKKIWGLTGENLARISQSLTSLNKDYKLLSITRPRLRFHNPANTYLNNYYYLTFEKRYQNDDWENDTLYPKIKNWPLVEYVAKDIIMKPTQVNDPTYPNDPLKNNMWYLNNTKTYDAWSAINYYDQWNIKVGIIESVWSHEDLEQGAGMGDSHGTHTAWSVAARTNNNKGVPAISNNNVQLVINPAAINYKSQRGKLDSVASQTKVVSISQLAWFRKRDSWEAEDLRDLFAAHPNTLFLVAAWNENLNPDTNHAINGYQYCCSPTDQAYNAPPWTWWIFPGELARSSRWLKNFINVAASTSTDWKASFTCYGNNRVSLASPWVNIRSTLPNNSYWWTNRQGTSMATPIAASLAWLLRALPKGSSLSAEEIKDVILSTADSISRQGWAWRINVCAAVAKIWYPCLNYQTPGCEIWTEQSCTPNSWDYQWICAISWTQTCIEAWVGWGWERSECTPDITPWQIPEGTGEAATCGDKVDNDCNGLTDCADTGCVLGEPIWENDERIICQSTGETICDDGWDNDGDSYPNPPVSWWWIDCGDSDCNGLTGQNDIICEYQNEQTCNDWGDNDGDWKSDCMDTEDCWVAVKIESSKGTGEFCGETILKLKVIIHSSTGINENDIIRSNGMTGNTIEITLSGPNNKNETYTVNVKNTNGCSAHSSITLKYRSSKPEICDNLIDDDCDQLSDCKDIDDCNDSCKTCADAWFDCSQPECQWMSYCSTYEANCCDKFDNDNDGNIDCQDSDCIGKPWCATTNIVGRLPISPQMFTEFKTQEKYVENALYVDFQKSIMTNFEEEIQKNFTNVRLSQPFKKNLWLSTRRIDFDKQQTSKKEIENYIQNSYKNAMPTIQPVPLFKIAAFQSNDELLQQQRYLNAITMTSIDSCGVTSEKKNKIAIVDNAFDITHEDLSKDNIEWYDIADNDTDISIPKKLLEWNHGTIAWWIVWAITNNQKGIAGMTNESPLILIKATSDTNNWTNVTAGIEWLLKAEEMWAKIINISRGTHEEVPLLEKVIKKLAKKGVILVAAAGNQNSDKPFYPAAYKEVIAVGAYDQDWNKASFSNYGKRIDVRAPWTSITTTNIANQYTTIDGTSEASPIVAAIMGLLADRNINTKQYIKWLTRLTNNTYTGKKISLENICIKKTTNKTTRIRVISTLGTILATLTIAVSISRKYHWFKSIEDDED